jgi:hypothetical protein
MMTDEEFSVLFSSANTSTACVPTLHTFAYFHLFQYLGYE